MVDTGPIQPGHIQPGHMQPGPTQVTGTAAARIGNTLDRPAQLRAAAAELEVTFLAEMLRSAGFGKPLEGFGGGIGEDQFASMLITEKARVLVASGGLGLTEHIFRALMEKENASA